MMKKVDLSELARRWPSAIVAREKVAEFTGGLITPHYLANLDSLGEGPKEVVRIGRKIAYPVAGLVEWLEGRAERRAL